MTEVLKMFPEAAAFSCPRSQFFTIRTDLKPVNNLFIFFQTLKRKAKSRKKTHASVTVTVVIDRKIRTALRANQIVGFVTVPAWKRNKALYCIDHNFIFQECVSLYRAHSQFTSILKRFSQLLPYLEAWTTVSRALLEVYY